MTALKYVKNNYVKIIAITLLAVLTSALTCYFLWPDPTPVMADNTDTYGIVQELVKDEVERFISEKEEILTEADVTELKERINDILDKNGLFMKTIFQSGELDRIIKECIEKSISGDRDAAAEMADDIVSLLHRIDENDKAYQELMKSYNAYQAEMNDIIRGLNEEDSRISGSKADKESTQKELDKLGEEINNTSEMARQYDRDAKDALNQRAASLEEGFRNGLNTNADAIRSNADGISANADSIANHSDRIAALNDSLTSITNSLSGKKIWVGTQEEYNAIAAKGDDTLYFIR